jgi:hypothetical protein
VVPRLAHASVTASAQHVASQWLSPHPADRTRSDTFWQDGARFGAVKTASHALSFVIYPGAAEGIVGTDILIVDALESGHYERYRAASAVIARTGGRLSHGATLLRELRKPSAVIAGANVDGSLDGARVRYADGALVQVDYT